MQHARFHKPGNTKQASSKTLTRSPMLTWKNTKHNTVFPIWNKHGFMFALKWQNLIKTDFCFSIFLVLVYLLLCHDCLNSICVTVYWSVCSKITISMADTARMQHYYTALHCEDLLFMLLIPRGRLFSLLWERLSFTRLLRPPKLSGTSVSWFPERSFHPTPPTGENRN